MTWISPDGSTFADRPHLDRMQLGWSPRYRLYETADGWLCLAAVTDEHVAALGRALEIDVAAGDAALGAALEAAFATRSASEWVGLLDGAGVPAEVSDHEFVRWLLDDPDTRAKQWITSYEHPIVGRMESFGLLFDLEDTPGRIYGPPLVPGQDTRAILDELGYDDERVEKLLAAGVVAERA
jgi:crotonobetainyl-CoA:carnitine CoA-transferase CaiB-like acyl-CoA transferase